MGYDKRVIKLQDNICGVRGIWLGKMSFFNTYSYVLCSEKNGEILLIDTCGPGSGRIIKHAVESMGRSMSDITGIALTHWHRDHTGSLAEVVSMAGSREKPVKVFIHKADAEFYLSQRIRLLNIHPKLRLKVLHSPGRLPEKGKYELIELDHESGVNPLIPWGVEFIHTPGHTPGHTSLLHKKSMSLFSGCGFSMIGKNTAGLVPVFYDRAKQIESARRIAQMEFSYFYPAHLSVRREEIKRENRVGISGRLSLTDRITGTMPIFRYPRG